MHLNPNNGCESWDFHKLSHSVSIFIYYIANMWTEGKEEHIAVILQGALKSLSGSLKRLLRKKNTQLSAISLGVFSISVWITTMDKGLEQS